LLVKYILTKIFILSETISHRT